MQSEPKQITSVGDLIDVARGLEVGSRWWRGQSKACWDLTPRVFRGENPAKLINRYLGDTKFPMTEERYEDRRFLEAERRFNREFRMSSSLFIDGVHKNSAADHVYFYVKAQHYGLPTRLLDWSTNPAIALFFASVHDVDYDGKMFSINPEMLVPNRIFPEIQEDFSHRYLRTIGNW